MISRFSKVGAALSGVGKSAQFLPQGLAVAHVTWEWWIDYTTAQKNVDVEKARIIETLADRKIKPQDLQVYPYLFASVYVLAGSFFVMQKTSFIKFRRLLKMTEDLIHTSCEIFERCPTKMATRDVLRHPLVKLVHSFDGPTNCFPSLHVSLAVLMKEVTEHYADLDPILKGVFRESCIDICRSTLELKQHSIIDVLGGQEIAHRILSKHLDLENCEDLSKYVMPDIQQDVLQDLRQCLMEKENIEDALPYMLDRLNKEG